MLLGKRIDMPIRVRVGMADVNQEHTSVIAAGYKKRLKKERKIRRIKWGLPF